MRPVSAGGSGGRPGPLGLLCRLALCTDHSLVMYSSSQKATGPVLLQGWSKNMLSLQVKGWLFSPLGQQTPSRLQALLSPFCSSHPPGKVLSGVLAWLLC